MVTNPFTIGVPRRGAEPLLLDFATSTIAHGKVRVAHNKGEQVQAGALIDAQGNPTTDPAVLFSTPMGALTAFGGHKGYALAVMCEMLGGALSGGHTLRPETIPDSPAIWNHMLTIVLDPAKLGSLDRFEQEMTAFEEWNASAALAPGADKIRLPGEPERDYRTKRAKAIEIDAGTVAQMDDAVKKLRARGLADAHLALIGELSGT
jgi:hydroxycarboxylate dehydrogenase B